jgi:hypothetical protein
MTAPARAFVAATTVWAALLPLAAIAATQPAAAGGSYAFAFLVYGAASIVCHQIPERSFELFAAQLPVCARCTGIYLGAAMAAVLTPIWLKVSGGIPESSSPAGQSAGRSGAAASGLPRPGAHSPQRVRWLLTGAAMPTLLTLTYEWTTGQAPSNAIRGAAGVAIGALSAAIVVSALSRTRARKVN